ncbi:AbrB family transcriptional regulator [Paenibacillus sp. Marseille-Q4541]|uniref:AbrB family transcriptional regulator n=1 Tax=Paenibacillus sp. Marseille-Q4541 TaxID=2831522 RepID=UPI0020189F0D|nr:AbrB family transcriptional regulator [Paenibacillus sp. Marseille-Q4541]
MNLTSPPMYRKWVRVIITFLTALAGGTLFHYLHIPIPWLLGAMVFVLMFSSKWGQLFFWPPAFRNTGMIIVGYTLGLSLTLSALHEITRQFPTMLLMTVLLLLLCGAMAFVLSRLTENDYLTMLMGSIPGGLSQVVALAEETKGVNVTVVTVMQVIRLMTIIISVPTLLFSPIVGQVHSAASPVGQLLESVTQGGRANLLVFLAYAFVCTLSALVANKLRFPTAYLLGPIIGAALLQMTSLPGPDLPAIVMNGAQLLIGAYLGLLLKPGQFTQRFRVLSLSLFGSVMLVAGSFGLSFLLSRYGNVSLPTALLSLAPGGMDQMSIMAHEIHADLSVVAVYQLFRLLFIYFAVPPLLRLIIQFIQKRKIADKRVGD